MRFRDNLIYRFQNKAIPTYTTSTQWRIVKRDEQGRPSILAVLGDENPQDDKTPFAYTVYVVRHLTPKGRPWIGVSVKSILGQCKGSKYHPTLTYHALTALLVLLKGPSNIRLYATESGARKYTRCHPGWSPYEVRNLDDGGGNIWIAARTNRSLACD